MTRPLRLEYPGALYHVMSRGDNKQKIFLNDHDHERFFVIYADIVKRLGWITFAWCLMDNHFHIVVETPEPNLSEGMRLLNGIYTQYYNHNHDRVGHLFQGRFRAIIVDRNAYLLELVRYVVLNPVRSGQVRDPAEWRWSSYRATAGIDRRPEWLDAGWVLEAISEGLGDRDQQKEKYRAFIAEGMKKETDLMERVQHQLYLGDEGFIERVQEKCTIGQVGPDIAREQKRKPLKFLDEYAADFPNHKEAMVRAYLEGGFSQAEIAKYFGVHYSTVSRAVRERRQQ
ncbi:MAG: hypothetical protein STSR0007_11520 [Thermovirga sp.]